ncbi:MAG TPA: molybdopterin cofactor-binding domain-containing protein [Usitatibacter sp.]|jgi:CO/xanthine dehydrogenase Mo-binding subunit|nr:molybdopterin cofactor-binding domain-containing protein [Usitatibacter sp.]
MSTTALPPSLARNPRLGRWLRFRPDGFVDVHSGKVELGQGILTALAAMVADELRIAPSRVRMIPACTRDSPDEGVTSGSLSIQDSGSALRQVCAEARALYLQAAARALGSQTDAIELRDGMFASSAGTTTYWALADDSLLDRDAEGREKAAPATERITRTSPRLDLPDKVMGRPRFIQDLVLRNMLHGRILRPPSPAAHLEALDEAAARALPGVVAVVRDGDFVGVVAEREETALTALDRLRRHVRWRETDSLPDESRMAEWVKAQPNETTVVADVKSDSASRAAPARTLRATFTRPFIAHASLAPSCAVARWRDEGVHVWSHTQGVFNLRADLAIALGVEASSIIVEHREGAGCYGHNGADDVALDAALLARAVPGRGVRVSWSREDELTWAPFGAAMAMDIAADLDASGEVLAWRGDVWSNGHSSRPGRAKTPTLLAAGHLAKPFERIPAINMPIATGGGSDRNAIPGYEFPAVHVENHRVLAMPIRTSALRSLGAFANIFAVESMVDEIARARGEDPVDWRLRHLRDPRARAVIEAAAARAPWKGWAPREGRGRGFGYARYKGNGACCAVAAEVELTHVVRVTRLAIVADVGFIVDSDGAANQLEGGAVQAASWALREAVRFDRTRITSGGWDTYPILRFSEVPDVDVALLPSHEPSIGAGEAAMGPTAAAIANAVFDACGARVRDLPITPERIAALL